MPERKPRLVGNQDELQGRAHPGQLDKEAFERHPKVTAAEPDLYHTRWTVEGTIKDLTAGTIGAGMVTGLGVLALIALEQVGQIIHP